MQYVIAVLLALFFDFLEYSQKYDDKVARRKPDGRSKRRRP